MIAAALPLQSWGWLALNAVAVLLFVIVELTARRPRWWRRRPSAPVAGPLEEWIREAEQREASMPAHEIGTQHWWLAWAESGGGDLPPAAGSCRPAARRTNRTAGNPAMSAGASAGTRFVTHRSGARSAAGATIGGERR